eukprot:gene17227-23548_t
MPRGVVGREDRAAPVGILCTEKTVSGQVRGPAPAPAPGLRPAARIATTAVVAVVTDEARSPLLLRARSNDPRYQLPADTRPLADTYAPRGPIAATNEGTI